MTVPVIWRLTVLHDSFFAVALQVDEGLRKFLYVALKLAYPSHSIQQFKVFKFGEAYVKGSETPRLSSAMGNCFMVILPTLNVAADLIFQTPQ